MESFGGGGVMREILTMRVCSSRGLEEVSHAGSRGRGTAEHRPRHGRAAASRRPQNRVRGRWEGDRRVVGGRASRASPGRRLTL